MDAPLVIACLALILRCLLPELMIHFFETSVMPKAERARALRLSKAAIPRPPTTAERMIKVRRDLADLRDRV